MKTYSEMAQFLIDNGGKYSYDWYMSNTRRLVAMYRECDKEVTAAASKQVRAAITAEKAIRNEAYADRLEELFGTDVDIIHAPLDKDAMIIPQRMIEIYAA